MKLNLNLLMLLGFIACAWAYPNPESLRTLDLVDFYEPENQLLEQELALPYEQPLQLVRVNDEPETELEVELEPEPEPESEPESEPEPEQLVRTRRQLNIQGGGSPRQGFDLSLNGRAPVWQSHNGRHSLDATGQYSQHLGGPYGNSRPNWGCRRDVYIPFLEGDCA